MIEANKLLESIAATNDQTRTYDLSSSVTFVKTKEKYGGLSNMAAGFPLVVNGIDIRTSEALYQACRFPGRPDVQELIINERSPMTAKMKSKPFREDTRPDWEDVRVSVMRWCLRVKLAQNWEKFGNLLLSTGDKPIVEKLINREDFWGATKMSDGSFVGINALGRLLMELRHLLKSDDSEKLKTVEPLSIPDFLIFQKPIRTIHGIQGKSGSSKEDTRIPAENLSHVQEASPKFSAPNLSKSMKSCSTKNTNKIKSKQIHDAFEPYLKYKNFNDLWLDKIPEDWNMRKIKNLFNERSQKGFPDKPLLTATQAKGVIPKSLYETRTVVAQKDLHLLKLVEVGDFVISLRSFQGGIEYAYFDGIISPAYTIMVPRGEIETRYFKYLAKSKPFLGLLKVCVTGIREGQNIDYERLKRAFLPLPNPSEQVQITRFLDWEIAQINKFIHNKQRLIELLKEQKQNIINQAVTRGLDPNVKLKPSGVEWIGDIPEHWEASQLKNFLSNNDGGVWGSDFGDDGVVVLRSTEQTVDGEWRISDPAKRILTEAEQAGATLSVGDLLVTKSSGSPSHIGKTTLVTDDVAALNPCFSNFMQRLRARPNVEPRYLWLYMNSWPARTQLQYLSNSTTGLGNLSSSIIGGIIMLLPPKPEQRTILSSLKNRLTSIELAIQRAMTEITLIQEYRTRLISDAVTGQIDVRHIKVPKGDVGADLSICLSDDLSESDYPIEEDEMLEVAE